MSNSPNRRGVPWLQHGWLARSWAGCQTGFFFPSWNTDARKFHLNSTCPWPILLMRCCSAHVSPLCGQRETLTLSLTLLAWHRHLYFLISTFQERAKPRIWQPNSGAQCVRLLLLPPPLSRSHRSRTQLVYGTSVAEAVALLRYAGRPSHSGSYAVLRMSCHPEMQRKMLPSCVRVVLLGSARNTAETRGR